MSEVKFSESMTLRALQELTKNWTGPRRRFGYDAIALIIKGLFPGVVESRKQLDGAMDSIYDSISAHCIKLRAKGFVDFKDGKAWLIETSKPQFCERCAELI